ncbi:MAG: tRNA 4-thiouridine(8) synthase ThiI [Bdellovibrionales bacterium]|nr:tRNA 4-thiouridine(8) synthase ThiI [Bdellovibrionales bacterium]
MNLYASLVLNFDEIWLKGLNRKFYIKILRKNVRKTVQSLMNSEFTYHSEGAKHILEHSEGFSDSVVKALRKIPGICSVSPSIKVTADEELEAIQKAIAIELENLSEKPKTFRVTTKRTNKKFPLKSMEVSRRVGGWVKAQFQLTPQMVQPDLEITLRIIEDSVYVSTVTYPGVGGLPVGTSGHMVCLLSGGFDSPVASFLMSKRGVDQTFVFFHAYPFVGDEVVEKIEALTKELSRYQRYAKLFIVPFGTIQKNIADHCKQDYRTILFRAYMIKTANELARRLKAKAIITGDALSQVSSQTIENIAAVDAVSRLPIFRPLIGFNKLEIINMSKTIETHDISILPHDDACSLFAPKHPVIRADKKYCKEFIAQLPLEEEIQKAIEESQVIYFNKAGERNEDCPENFLS